MEKESTRSWTTITVSAVVFSASLYGLSLLNKLILLPHSPSDTAVVIGGFLGVISVSCISAIVLAREIIRITRR